MSLIIWIIVGGLAGWIASLIMKTDEQMGCFANIVVGMIGSVLGGAVVILLQGGGLDFTTAFTNFNLTSILVSILGAVIFLAILKMLRK
jgi:uncharacterized membrane protein YeaQ/YmgE (transglycosylase-associated protein family)